MAEEHHARYYSSLRWGEDAHVAQSNLLREEQDETYDSLRAARDKGEKGDWVKELVQDVRFESLMGVFILVNCVSIGAEVHLCPHLSSRRFQIRPGCEEEVLTSAAAEGGVQDSPCDYSEVCPNEFLVVLENLFTAIFVIEFFLRAKAFGISFYYKSFNNLADAFLVWGTGVLLVWVLKPLQVPAGMLRNLTVLRTFRLLRVARVVRTMPQFKEMWLLLKGLADSMHTLFWTVVMICFVNFVFGVFAVIAIGDSEAYTEANELALQASGGLEGDPNFYCRSTSWGWTRLCSPSSK